ncbi:unnamed protein product [Durusdinium trenchii]|uniref:RNase H type-1 domain-containing protein n=1 Tax=Durusdinium trenchii TaxID=1381693 RepID=A0ABP0IEB2_9DINO
MKTRLEAGRPVQISDQDLLQWFIYTDAAYNMEEQTGGIGGVLVDQSGVCVQWFGFPLNEEMCKTFGCQTKQSIIYELELVAAVHALSYWGDHLAGNLATWFGDNDSVRYALIRGAAIGPCGEVIMRFHLEKEASLHSRAWFARVPTEANIADFPSRLSQHPLLVPKADVTDSARHSFQSLISTVDSNSGIHVVDGGDKERASPSSKKKRWLA